MRSSLCLVSIASHAGLLVSSVLATEISPAPLLGTNIPSNDPAVYLEKNMSAMNRSWHSVSVIAKLALVLAVMAMAFAIMQCYLTLQAAVLSKDKILRRLRLTDGGETQCAVSMNVPWNFQACSEEMDLTKVTASHALFWPLAEHRKKHMVHVYPIICSSTR